MAAFLVTAPGCAVHLKGVVHPAAGGAQLVAPDGERWKLILLGNAQPVAALDGHMVEVSGTRIFRTVRIRDWKIIEGLHAMSVWVGTVRPMGQQLGIDDRNSGAFYLIDDASHAVLGPHAGAVVLLEGYVVGPHRIKVMYYRLLQ